MALQRHTPITQPPLPYQRGVIAEAFRLALAGTTPAFLTVLAQQNGRSLAYIMVNLRKGSRQTQKRIGKRGWQWDLLETPTLIKIEGLKRTANHEIQVRARYGVRDGSEKP